MTRRSGVAIRVRMLMSARRMVLAGAQTPLTGRRDGRLGRSLAHFRVGLLHLSARRATPKGQRRAHEGSGTSERPRSWASAGRLRDRCPGWWAVPALLGPLLPGDHVAGLATGRPGAFDRGDRAAARNRRRGDAHRSNRPKERRDHLQPGPGDRVRRLPLRRLLHTDGPRGSRRPGGQLTLLGRLPRSCARSG